MSPGSVAQQRRVSCVSLSFCVYQQHHCLRSAAALAFPHTTVSTLLGSGSMAYIVVHSCCCCSRTLHTINPILSFCVPSLPPHPLSPSSLLTPSPSSPPLPSSLPPHSTPLPHSLRSTLPFIPPHPLFPFSLLTHSPFLPPHLLSLPPSLTALPFLPHSFALSQLSILQEQPRKDGVEITVVPSSFSTSSSSLLSPAPAGFLDTSQSCPGTPAPQHAKQGSAGPSNMATLKRPTSLSRHASAAGLLTRGVQILAYEFIERVEKFSGRLCELYMCHKQGGPMTQSPIAYGLLFLVSCR